jgi:hypothetical protein
VDLRTILTLSSVKNVSAVVTVQEGVIRNLCKWAWLAAAWGASRVDYVSFFARENLALAS